MLSIKRSATATRSRYICAWSTTLLLLAPACASQEVAPAASEIVLRMGFGLASGQGSENGVQQVARNVALENLFRAGRDGRSAPVLADEWTVSADGLALSLALKKGLRFHDGTTAEAETIGELLEGSLKRTLGPAFGDIRAIRSKDNHLEFALSRPSAFLLEGLDSQIAQPGADIVGTGPFSVSARQEGRIEMAANEHYHAGRPKIDKIIITPYTSVRAAWADMLRGRVDMLYDVGADAIDSLKSSSDVEIFPFQRAYAFIVLLNARRAPLNNPAIRRALNAAIDRDALVRDILKGRGRAAPGPIWPGHWAYSTSLPQFHYQPEQVAPADKRLRLKCLVVEPSHERLALAVQRQLRAIGVELELEMVGPREGFARLQSGDFDAYLADAIQGPNLVRPYLWWHSGGPFNSTGYRNPDVDAALTSIRHATDDAAYASGVAAFQRAVIEDPPAIFLAWRERARAVSRRFEVPSEPGDDVLSTLHLWKPRTEEQLASRR